MNTPSRHVPSVSSAIRYFKRPTHPTTPVQLSLHQSLTCWQSKEEPPKWMEQGNRSHSAASVDSSLPAVHPEAKRAIHRTSSGASDGDTKPFQVSLQFALTSVVCLSVLLVSVVCVLHAYVLRTQDPVSTIAPSRQTQMRKCIESSTFRLRHMPIIIRALSSPSNASSPFHMPYPMTGTDALNEAVIQVLGVFYHKWGEGSGSVRQPFSSYIVQLPGRVLERVNQVSLCEVVLRAGQGVQALPIDDSSSLLQAAAQISDLLTSASNSFIVIYRPYESCTAVDPEHVLVPSTSFLFRTSDEPKDGLSSLLTSHGLMPYTSAVTDSHSVMTVSIAFGCFSLLAGTSAVLLAVCTGWYVSDILDDTVNTLRESSQLQWARSQIHRASSLFSEALYLQLACRSLQRHLMCIKSSLPASLFSLLITHCHSELPAGDQCPQADNSSASRCNCKEVEPVAVEDMGEGVTAAHVAGKCQQIGRLKAKTLYGRSNSFQRRLCTVICISQCYFQDKFAYMDDYFQCIYSTVMECNGFVDVMKPNYVIISFNAHLTVTMHASNACKCAMLLSRRLSVIHRQQPTILVDCAEYLVGALKSPQGNVSHYIFDMMRITDIIFLMHSRLMPGVFATHTAATHIPDNWSIPVARVRLEGYTIPFVLCELREPRRHVGIEDLTYITGRYRTAFHYMIQKEYAQARQIYSSMSKSDPTAQYMIKRCEQLLTSGSELDGILTVVNQPLVLSTDVLMLFTRGSQLVSTPSPSCSDSNSQITSQSDSFGSLTDNHHINTLPSCLPRCPSLPVPSCVSQSTTCPLTPYSRASRNNYVLNTPKCHITSPKYCSDPPLSDSQCSWSDDHPFDVNSVNGSCSSEPSTGALVEWIHVPTSVSSNSDTESLLADFESVDEHTCGSHYRPLHFIDEDGTYWMRSVQPISEGAFSVVYLGMSEEGEQVAIKCIPRLARSSRGDVEAEIHMMAQLRHPNIVQYISYSVTSSHLAIIMEYVPGGSLHAVIGNFGKLNGTVVRRFMIDIINGLAYLHTGGIVHCDVKPHNMLLGMDGMCKLSDFGSTISEAADMARTMGDELVLRGTALYMAPEVARGERCTPQSDIFSLGVSLMEMLLGRLPWRWSSTAPEGSDEAQLHALFRNDPRFVQCLGRGEVEVDIPDSLEYEAHLFAKACCQLDPAKRPSAQELLAYPFIL